uniref:Uncharacterized protein n=1 Tax=Manihot esculenta TaxID=3983 RepID=A0A2C9V1Z0_MANES
MHTGDKWYFTKWFWSYFYQLDSVILEKEILFPTLQVDS